MDAIELSDQVSSKCCGAAILCVEMCINFERSASCAKRELQVGKHFFLTMCAQHRLESFGIRMIVVLPKDNIATV